MSYNTNPVTANNTMYIDDKLTVQNQNISYNISYGNNNNGFQTPSTNYLPYTVNSDGSVSYQEQGKTITVSCSETSIPDLYLLLQPYNFNNNINQGFSGYDSTGFLTLDATHTVYDNVNLINYYGIWFNYDVSSYNGNFVFNKIIINLSDYTQGIKSVIVFGSNDNATWYDIYMGQLYDYNVNQVLTHTYTKSSGNITYNYIRIMIQKVSNNSNFVISGIQFVNDLLLASNNFGTSSSSAIVSVGNFTSQLNLRYTTVQKNIGTIGNLILDADLDNTYPPTNTNGLIPPSVNVATQLYNQVNSIITTPLFFLRYMLTGTFTTVAVTNYNFFFIGTSQQAFLNGLALTAVRNSTNGRLTIPYTGIYCITETVGTNAVATTFHLDIYSVSGTYGTGQVISQLTTITTDVSCQLSYTGYFATGDIIVVEFYTSGAVALWNIAGACASSIALITKTS